MIIKVLNAFYVCLIRISRLCKKNLNIIITASFNTIFLICKIDYFKVSFIIALSPIFAILSFYVSYLLISKRIKINIRKIFKSKIGFVNILKVFVLANFEELLFRGLIYSYIFETFQNIFMAFTISIVAFLVFHIKRFIYCNINIMLYIFDLLVFAVTITIIYCLTFDIFSVVAIHMIRNILIEKYNYSMKSRSTSYGELHYRKSTFI